LYTKTVETERMPILNSHPSGRHFLQIPGPSNVPDRVLRAMDFPTIDHRGPEFAAIGKSVLDGMKQVFRTNAHVVIFPSSGTGAFRKIVLERFNMSLGQGLSRISGKVFRIGHPGDFNYLTLCGTMAGVEMGLGLAGVPHRKGGAQAAMDYLAESSAPRMAQAA
jgi:aspartate aminotransferase-like enzyme